MKSLWKYFHVVLFVLKKLQNEIWDFFRICLWSYLAVKGLMFVFLSLFFRCLNNQPRTYFYEDTVSLIETRSEFLAISPMFYISVALEEIFLFILLNNFVPQFTEASSVSWECSINCYSRANVENFNQ